jgi:regulator of sigma E protease
LSWFLAFAGFSALIVLHELGHFTAAKAVGMRVERFSLFFPPYLARKRRGETEYCVGTIPLGGFVKITGMNPEEEIPLEDPAADPADAAPESEPKTVPADQYPRSYSSAPVWKRIVVIAAGPFVNFVIAFVILFFLAFDVAQPTNTVESVAKDTPAAEVLMPGDRLLSVDGVTGELEALREQLASHECAGEQTDGCVSAEPATIVIERDGRELTVEASPVYDAASQRPLLGFQYGVRPLEPGVGGAAHWAVDRMWDVTSQTVSIVGRIFNAEQREQISGVVGSYEVTRQSIEFDTRQALFVLALISLSLAVINLFPFLPLDGGHIFWAVVEKIRGRRVTLRTMERASVVGFALVMVLFAIGLTNDIGRLTGEGFNVR